MATPTARRLAGVFSLVVAACAAMVSVSALAQGNAQTGKQKAMACAVCHGPNGVSNAPDAPNLAGQPAIYLARQLTAYRSGERKHEVMSVMAKPLTDADIEHLAAWYASIRVEATPSQ